MREEGGAGMDARWAEKGLKGRLGEGHRLVSLFFFILGFVFLFSFFPWIQIQRYGMISKEMHTKHMHQTK